jgi:hypothetical protein
VHREGKEHFEASATHMKGELREGKRRLDCEIGVEARGWVIVFSARRMRPRKALCQETGGVMVRGLRGCLEEARGQWSQPYWEKLPGSVASPTGNVANAITTIHMYTKGILVDVLLNQT